MKVYVYPSDENGCGKFRMIWPAEALKRAGHDVTIVRPGERWNIGVKHRGDTVIDAFCPDDADVLVMQRISHVYMTAAVGILRRKGVPVVVDIDDDVTSIHPDNPAFRTGNPKHQWQNVKRACAQASIVTVSSDALAQRYGSHGRVRVIRNYLPESYYDLERVDGDHVVWPAAIHSHPNDPAAVGSALRRLTGEGVTLRTIGRESIRDQVQRAFGVQGVDLVQPSTPDGWPKTLASIGGVGIAPLADTKFNAAKSWLKPLEMSAAGIPWVASNRAEYALFHRESGAGELADSAGQWYRKVRQLLDDPVYRGEMSEKARSAALGFRLEEHAWRWLEAWQWASVHP